MDESSPDKTTRAFYRIGARMAAEATKYLADAFFFPIGEEKGHFIERVAWAAANFALTDLPVQLQTHLVTSSLTTARLTNAAVDEALGRKLCECGHGFGAHLEGGCIGCGTTAEFVDDEPAGEVPDCEEYVEAGKDAKAKAA